MADYDCYSLDDEAMLREIPPAALELLGRSPPELQPLLKQLYNRDRGPYERALVRLMREWTKPSMRAAAAPTVLPYLYGLMGPNEQQELRSLLLQQIGYLATGFGEDCEPHGFDGTGDADRGGGADARSAYLAVEATLPSMYPFLEDGEAPVRAQAAHVLAFFPSARETASPALLALVAREPNTEVRCSASVAVAMLHRSVAAEAERTAVCAQLEQLWATAAAAAAQDADAANVAAMARFTVAVARCIVGVHAVDDVEVLAQLLTSPLNAKQLPREPARGLETTLPFAYPALKALAGRVLHRLPGPGPQPLAVVRVLAARVRHAPPAFVIYAIDATLHSACGGGDDDAIPAEWPAFAALDEGQKEAVRGLAKFENDAYILLRSRLERWRLPASASGLKAYMGGTPAAVAAEQSQAELDNKLQKKIDKVVKRRNCCLFLG